MNDILICLGKRIADLRNKRGLTQERLAELVNYSPNHISKLESARTNPSFDLLVKLSKAFNIEFKELFNFNEYKSIEIMKKELLKEISSENKNIAILYKIYHSMVD